MKVSWAISKILYNSKYKIINKNGEFNWTHHFFVCFKIIGYKFCNVWASTNLSNSFEKFLNALADEIVKRFSDKKIEILSFQDSIDLAICEKFARILYKKGLENIEVIKGLSVNEVFEKISDLEFLIGMRFHANVVAIKSGVKALAINYDIKVKKLADEYNLPLIELKQTDFSKEFNSLLD